MESRRGEFNSTKVPASARVVTELIPEANAPIVPKTPTSRAGYSGRADKPDAEQLWGASCGYWIVDKKPDSSTNRRTLGAEDQELVHQGSKSCRCSSTLANTS